MADTQTASAPAVPKTPKEYRIIAWHNPPIRRSGFEFRYEEHAHPRLVQLRERYRLDDVIAGGSSEFERQQLLRGWVTSRWPHGWDHSAASATDALEMLEAAEKGYCFACGYYNVTFIQCCLAMGWQARPLAIAKEGADFYPPWEGNVGHSVTEVWSNQYLQWILMDADLNAHFMLDGMPLSGLEMHRAWHNGDWERVEQVTGEPAPRVAYEKAAPWFNAETEIGRFTRHATMDYFATLAIMMGNDFASRGDWGRRLCWCDDWSPLRLVDSANQWTQREEDIDWSLNQAHISLRGQRGEAGQWLPRVQVSLETQDPWPGRFEVRAGEGAWSTSPERFELELAAGDTLLAARHVNAAGVAGHEHWARLRWEEWPGEPFPGKMRPCY